MHTLIVVDDGVLRTSIYSEVEADISVQRWRAAIAPAVALLQAVGGGTLCVPHNPLTLLA